MEHALPDTAVVQPVNVTDGHAQQTWMLGDKQEQKAYRIWREQQESAIAAAFSRSRVSHHHVSAGLSLDEQLLELQGGAR